MTGLVHDPLSQEVFFGKSLGCDSKFSERFNVNLFNRSPNINVVPAPVCNSGKCIKDRYSNSLGCTKSDVW